MTSDLCFLRCIFTPNSKPETPETNKKPVNKNAGQKTADQKKSNGQAPKTGDETPIELYLILLALSSTCIALLGRKRKITYNKLRKFITE